MVLKTTTNLHRMCGEMRLHFSVDSINKSLRTPPPYKMFGRFDGIVSCSFVLCLLCLLLNVNCYKWEANENNFVALLIICESFGGSKVKQWLRKRRTSGKFHITNSDTRTHTYMNTPHTRIIYFSFISLRVSLSFVVHHAREKKKN